MTRAQSIQAGDWLKEQRAERNITVSALNKYLNVSVSTLRKWENGEIPYNYICHGLQYFFDGWEKNPLRKCNLEEIPDHPTLSDGSWLSWWLETEGVRVTELADYLGMSTGGVYAWMKPDKKIPIIAEYAIRQAMSELTKRNYIRG